VSFFHPRRHRSDDHFLIRGAVIEPLTPEGKATARLRKLNLDKRVVERRLLTAVGRYHAEIGRSARFPRGRVPAANRQAAPHLAHMASHPAGRFIAARGFMLPAVLQKEAKGEDICVRPVYSNFFTRAGSEIRTKADEIISINGNDIGTVDPRNGALVSFFTLGAGAGMTTPCSEAP